MMRPLPRRPVTSVNRSLDMGGHPDIRPPAEQAADQPYQRFRCRFNSQGSSAVRPSSRVGD